MVALGLSAPQLLPTLELRVLSIRAGTLGYGMATSYSLPLALILKGLLPTYGAPTISIELIGYVGMAGLILSAAALALRPDRRVVGLLLAALLGLALAFGQYDPLYHLAYRFVPGISLFRVPGRWLMVYTVALAGLVGVGLDYLGRPSRSGGGARPKSKDGARVARFLAVLLGPAVGLAVVLALYQRLRGHVVEVPGGLTVGIWAASAVLGVALVLVALRRSDIARRGAAAGLLVLLAAELFGASLVASPNQTVPDRAATDTTPEVQYLQSATRASPDAPFRLLSVGNQTYTLADQAAIAASLGAQMRPDEVDAYLVAIRNRQLELPNVPLVFGLSTLDGYDGGVLPLQRWVDLTSLLMKEARVPIAPVWMQLKTVPDPKLLSWLNVRYLIVDRSIDAEKVSPSYRLVYSGDTKVYENLAVLPRAYVVGRVLSVGSDQAALEVLRSSSFDPRAEAVVTAGALEAAGIQPQAGQSAQARIVSYADERVVVETDLSSPGLLVLADTNYPGWKAVVDGVERPIVTTDYLFRGVWLGAGKHRVEFRFEPTSFSRGVLIAAVTVVLTLMLLVLGPGLERRLSLLDRHDR